MNRKKKNFLLLLLASLVIAILLIACSSQEETATPETEVDFQDFTPFVSATGEVIPKQSALISVKTGGVVAEILVSEGDAVKTGEVLLRLEGTEQLQAAVSSAKFELANAQYALDGLYKDTNLLAAQALQAKDDAEKALEDLNDPELQQAQALKAIADAKKAIDDSERKLNNLGLPAEKVDIDAQRSRVVLARDALEKAEDDYKPYEDKPEDNLQRANYQARLAQAQKEYDAAVRILNSLEGTATEIDIIIAEAEFALANAQLNEAEEEYERLNDGPNQADVALLEAQIETAAQDYEIYKDGPDPDDVAIAEARLENAQSQLAAAEAQLADLELIAPFDGTVSEININPSEWVNPGQPVLRIADLDHLQVETTDLGEIDVAQISVGETAIITFDALPDETVTGTVVSIAPKSSAGSGVNYRVVLEMEDTPVALRWGMTAFVDIELDQ